MRWSELALGALLGLMSVHAHSVVDPLMELRAIQGNKLFVSTDGSCGAGVTCLGSGFGSCCGAHGYCGSSNMACGAGCRPEFGTCSEQVVLQSRAIGDDLHTSRRRSGELSVSKDGSCGLESTCLGAAAGECCSRDGWCGSSESYCGAGCKEGFGLCKSDGSLARRQEPEDEACDAPSSAEPVPSSSTVVAASSSAAAAASSSSVVAAASSTAAPSSTAASTPAPQLSTIRTTSTAAAAVTTTVRTSTVATTTSARPASVTPTPTPPPVPVQVSKNGKCGAASNQTCKGSSILIGPCCSKSGQCGYLGCLKMLGCQTSYGTCI
ncbi:hypothetical protein F5X68DRAFT_231864 [Plectosphaerella plurivora]|uniref:Chitin-binding type-1 domain-containing protein n=1 Tax=Plectosphaerella plurivora TaxID=936078 RepID=A0A9P8VC96_9PEZI|nr:hypothetical protein F5X68DRAFT_231864 [Plectosphaerella plurivora]